MYHVMGGGEQGWKTWGKVHVYFLRRQHFFQHALRGRKRKMFVGNFESERSWAWSEMKSNA